MSSPVPSRYVGPERIYRGGTADVYSALDRELGRKVAIKILADRSRRARGCAGKPWRWPVSRT